MTEGRLKKKFDFKSFISFGLLFSFIIISITGVILYITPPGRVAKWVKWTLFGLEKEEWQAIHTIFSFFFLILGIFHIFKFNWKVIIAYIKKKAVSGASKKKEFFVSMAVVIILLTGTIAKLPPLQSIMDLGEYFTESWEKKEESAPIAHTEELTIPELSEKVLKITPEEILRKLEELNIKADLKSTLKEIGEANGISPFEVYQVISDKEEKKEAPQELFKEGSGMGRKTLEEISVNLQLDPEEVLLHLRSLGIDAALNEKLKDIAERAEISPFDLVEKIKKSKK
ncbi:MAG: DUF4405 domain-containing protein [Acidobacteriota bacterium]